MFVKTEMLLFLWVKYFTLHTCELFERVKLGLHYRSKFVPLLLHPPRFPTDLPQFPSWLHLIGDT